MTPDNAIYYQIAYAAAAVIYVGYAISLRIRERHVRDRLASNSADDARR